MSISGINNIFEILSDDYEQKPKSQTESKKEEAKKKAPATVTKPKQEQQPPAKGKEKVVAPKQAPKEEGSHVPLPSKESRMVKRDRTDRDKPIRGGLPGGRGGGNRRTFDKHSGTGRGKEGKKGGAGKGNWGSVVDAEKEEEEPRKDEPTEKPVEATEGTEEVKHEEGQTEESKEEKEPETFLLTDYLKSKKSVKPAVDVKVRRAGEGVDQAAWSEFVELKKEEGDVKKQEKKEKKEKDVKEPAKKQTSVPVDQIFNVNSQESRPQRGRGGSRRGSFSRGGGEGRGGNEGRGGSEGRGSGRGSFRGNKRGSKAPSFSMTDDAFPTLTKA